MCQAEVHIQDNGGQTLVNEHSCALSRHKKPEYVNGLANLLNMTKNNVGSRPNAVVQEFNLLWVIEYIVLE